MHTRELDISNEKICLDDLSPLLLKYSGLLGLAGLIAAFLLSWMLDDSMKRFFHSYLVSYSFFLSLTLGALFFVLLQHVTRSGWSIVIRRLAEILAANIPALVVLFVPVLLGMGELYHWTHPDIVAADPLLFAKKPYLNIPFFFVRCIAYFAIWWLLSSYLLDRSTEQDESGDPRLTIKMETISPIGMFLFALTLTFFSFDALMSLEPHWYSTIYGVYYFAGSTVGFIAILTVLVYCLQRKGRLANAITVEHYHDLGKLLFAFLFFWAYIAFSQYMLIWYGNIPEETMWYFARQDGQWKWISLLLLFGHFVIPFFGLLSRYPKRRKTLLFGWALWMLAMHYIDLYWLVMPQFSKGILPLHVTDLACFVGVGGIWLYGIVRIAKKRSLLAIKDPRLEESITFENA